MRIESEKEGKITCVRDDTGSRQRRPGGGDLVKVPIDIIKCIILVRLLQRDLIVIWKSVVGRGSRRGRLECSWLLVTGKLGGFWGGRDAMMHAWVTRRRRRRRRRREGCNDACRVTRRPSMSEE